MKTLIATPESFLVFANQLPEPMILVSGNGVALAFNRACEDRFGVRVSEWRGKPLVDLAIDPPGEIAHYLHLCSRSRQPVLGAITIRGRDEIECRAEGSLLSPKTEESNAVLMVRLIPKQTATAQFIALNLRIEQLAQEVRRRKQAEHDVRESAELLRTTLASIGDGVIATDIDGLITNMNAVAASLTGWTSDAASGVPLARVFNIVNEATRQPAESPAERALREGTIVGLANHTLLIAKDGTERPIDDSAAPIRTTEGRIAGCVLVFREITERRELERQNAERLHAAQYLSAIVDSSGDAIISKSLEGIIQSWNGAAERLFEYSVAEAVGRHISLIIPTDRLDEETEIISRIRAGMRVENFDTVRVRKDGRTIPVSLTISPVRDEHGRIIGASKIAHDITERNQIEEQLRTSNVRLSGILQQSPAGIVQADATGRMTLVNERWCRMLGYSEAELLSRSFFEITHSSSLAATSEAVGRLVAGAAELQIQKNYVRKDGSLLPAQSNLTAVRSAQGKFEGVIAVVVDLSERLRIEEELLRVATELSEADSRKNEFLATLAHELRNPLAPIRNGLELIRLAAGNWDTVKRASEVIDRQLNHMVHLVNDLMDVSRIATGKVQLQKERVTLASVVQSAVETSRPLIEQMGHTLTVTLPQHPLHINVDSTRLAQVFLNLLNNAAKYSARNSQIWMNAEQQEKEIVVSVKDTGIGISADQLTHIFEMFSQVDRSLERSHGGLGIGLCLVKRLVELHDGRIEVRSEGLGKGAEFVARLPVVVESSRPPQEASRLEADPSTRRILIVDDNRDSADSLATLLTMMGNETHAAYDGEEAVTETERFRPDVILLDIGLPKLNGYEACRRIRRLELGKTIIIIAQTGWGQEEDRKRTHEAGFDHHLVKPVDTQILMKLLRSLSERSMGIAS